VRGYISQRDKLLQNRLRVRKTRESKRVEENQNNKACLMKRGKRAQYYGPCPLRPGYGSASLFLVWPGVFFSL